MSNTPNEDCAQDVGQEKPIHDVTESYDSEHGLYKDIVGTGTGDQDGRKNTVSPFGSLK